MTATAHAPLILAASAPIRRAPSGVDTELSGWGNNRRVPCRLLEPETPAQTAAWLDRAGTIARGLGRSYGDAATNAGRQVLGLTRLDAYLAFDEASGRLTCEAGVSLAQIIKHFAPRGWFPMITPGTKFVTIGGSIANDVHGKAHHVQGSFSNSVDELTLLLANGDVVRASREENPELFWATFGGMGLLGIVLTATIRLRRIETTFFRQRSFVVKNLEEMLAVLAEQDRAFPYSVATIDVFATGKRLGRGVVTVGEHASYAELPPKLQRDPLRGLAASRIPELIPWPANGGVRWAASPARKTRPVRQRSAMRAWYV